MGGAGCAAAEGRPLADPRDTRERRLHTLVQVSRLRGRFKSDIPQYITYDLIPAFEFNYKYVIPLLYNPN